VVLFADIFNLFPLLVCFICRWLSVPRVFRQISKLCFFWKNPGPLSGAPFILLALGFNLLASCGVPLNCFIVRFAATPQEAARFFQLLSASDFSGWHLAIKTETGSPFFVFVYSILMIFNFQSQSFILNIFFPINFFRFTKDFVNIF
jgi:hypothetical protein